MAVVGSSPEILVRLRDQKVTIRQLLAHANARPPDEDAANAADLMADVKGVPNI